MQAIGRQASDLGYYSSHHPLIKLIDFADGNYPLRDKIQTGLYYIFLSPLVNNKGRLLFITPETRTNLSLVTSSSYAVGQALAFDPELLKGTTLAESLADYLFFNYSAGKPLTLTWREYQLALDFFFNIKMELTHTLDRHSKRLIASNIEVFLNYCERFFSDQSILDEPSHKGVVQRFDKMLSRYFSSENPFKFGIPSVAFCADQLHLSPKYFGSLIKKATGKTAQEYIRDKILAEAKYRIIDLDKTINEIAFELGFKYPQHFSRYFKKAIGQTPNHYKQDLHSST